MAIITFTVFNILFYTFSFVNCLKRLDLEDQSKLFKDIATKLKQSAQNLPTQSQVIQEIKRIDDEEFDKIDKRIIQEENELKQHHGSCEPLSYERDYTFTCPKDWTLGEDGLCWGQNYHGSCESRQSFKWFTTDQKKHIEETCCISWPIKQKVPRQSVALHGSVNPINGNVVSPRA